MKGGIEGGLVFQRPLNLPLIKGEKWLKHFAEVKVPRFRVLPFIVLIVYLLPVWLYAQTDTAPDGTEGETIVKKDAPKKPWNEFDLGFTTIKPGLGFLYEYGTFDQDEDSKKQSEIGNYELKPTFKVRDFRLLLSGQLNTQRTITWKTGVMYDGPSRSWFVRETGVTISVPELWGNIFIGRTKEGFSLNKVMNGYAGWTMERQMALDVIPILADGIKWLGWLPKQHLFWNAGAYGDWLSEGQSFSTYKWQLVARFGYLPIYSPENKTLLHIGTSIRYGEVKDGEIQVRSRPEANTAPYFIDTGKFPSDHSTQIGYEVYYSNHSLMLGSEYYVHNFHSPELDNPQFRGGDAVVSYILTGESRAYSTVSGIYSFVPVAKSVFKGGPGAIEVLLRYSRLNLNSDLINGGNFWRITPMVNWYLSPMIRFEVCYGYGTLDRFNLTGATQFFQSRIQFVIL
ncbi:MAG: porin [Acidobacteria bacterium]|nr:MAG: porin [Acidobacteriota bacterium]